MSSISESKFSAADAALGYAYQVRCALLYSLIHARNDIDFEVGIETLDDVTFTTTGGEPIELLQTKHHVNSKSTVTDSAVDIWKTLRIWAEASQQGILPANAKLYLITTANASSGSAVAKLRVNSTDRDPEAALGSFNSIALSSQSQSNSQAYQSFLALTQEERLTLLNQIYVIDSAPNITDIDTELARQVRWLAPDEQEEAFLQRLEGWWYRRVLNQLSKSGNLINSREIDLYMQELREQFTREALPIDDDVVALELNEALQQSCQNRLFVKQVELVTKNTRRIGFAIRDYFRAYEQRARWLRQDIVLGLELDKYETQLVEEWESAYERMCDELGEENTEELMEKAGRALLDWAEINLFPIRPKVTAKFISTGSFHMLSDDGRVGWHPLFKERLEILLS